MVATDKLFAGSIPEIYDRYLVPLIFEPYAADLAVRLTAFRPQTVLETAAGTGVLTRAMAAELPAHVRIVATDLNQPMLDHASARLGPDSRISWHQADALALPFADQSFDAVVCQFGVMFFPDRAQGFREARRVLQPAGRFLFNAWDRISENAFAEVVTEALAAAFPGRSSKISWHGRRTAIMTWSASGPMSRRRDFVASPSRRGRSRATPSAPATSPSPIAKGLRRETRSRLATPRACRRRPRSQSKRSRSDLGAAPSQAEWQPT